jgi:chemotaxis protein CheC
VSDETRDDLRVLQAIFERGAERASEALSRWLGHPVRLSISAVEEVDLTEVSEWLGPGESLVASCVMGLSGSLNGSLLLVFEDASGLALADLVLQRPLGAATSWGDLEQSAAMETANIVGCSFLNALATHLPALSASGGGSLVPSPPIFRHEFAASLLEFAVMDQAVDADRVLLVRSRFEAASSDLNWSLVYVPGGDSLASLLRGLGFPDGASS